MLISLSCIGGASGAFSSSALADDEQLKNFINDCQGHLDQTRDQVSNLETSYAPMGDFASGDLAKMDHDYRPTIAAWELALATFQKGDFAKGETLRNAAISAAPAIDWGRRLQYRQRMYYLDLNDRWVLANVSWSVPGAWPALNDWLKVKKKCSLAWGRAAEAMTGAADGSHAENDAYEVAKAADIEEETAHMDFDVAKVIYNDLTRDKDVSSPELTRAIDAIKKLEKDRVSLRMEDIDRDRKSREYERDMAKLQAEAHQAFSAARNARDASRNKH